MRVRFVESAEKYNHRLSVGQDVLLPIPLPHLEPIEECVCDCMCCSITRVLRSNDATATRKSLEKWVCTLLVLRFSLHTYFIKCRQTQLELNSYGTYPRTYPSFKREIRFSSLLVYVLHKTRNWAFSRRSNANTAKKCTKSVMHVQSCCFDVLFAVTLLDEWIFKSL